MTKAQKTTRLSERAMLVQFSVSFWEGRKRDKQVTSDTLKDKGAEKESGAWWTRSIPAR